jgi:hypothetical protein
MASRKRLRRGFRPVDGARVAGLRDQLGREVLGRAAQRVGLLPRGQLLGEAEVGHLHIARHIYQQVLRLQVPAQATPAHTPCVGLVLVLAAHVALLPHKALLLEACGAA